MPKKEQLPLYMVLELNPEAVGNDRDFVNDHIGAYLTKSDAMETIKAVASECPTLHLFKLVPVARYDSDLTTKVTEY